MKSDLAILGGSRAVTEDWVQDWPYVDSKEEAAVLALVRSRTLSIYDRSGVIAEFEDSFAAYHATPDRVPRALTHNSGTSALTACYFGLGVMPGDEVIVPTYTFLATVTPLLLFGATPVFVDMEPDTLAIDPLKVREAITNRTVGVVATHMWGHPANMTALQDIAKKHALFLVEDCSHAHGASIDGRKVGTFGDASAFSLEGHKAMVAGEGGVMLTTRREVYERALMLGHFGRRIKDEISLPELLPYIDTGFGQKYRMHPLGAAIATVQLERLDARNETRRRNLERLSVHLEGTAGVRPPVTKIGHTRGGWYGYKPEYLEDELSGLTLHRFMEALQAEGVKVKRPGSPPLHQLPVFRLSDTERSRLKIPWRGAGGRSWPDQGFPVADSVYGRLLSLPTFSGSCDEVIDQYGAAFSKVARAHRELL